MTNTPTRRAGDPQLAVLLEKVETMGESQERMENKLDTLWDNFQQQKGASAATKYYAGMFGSVIGGLFVAACDMWVKVKS